MCGIFGYIGKGKADLSGFLLQGLQKLEYRGYDSSGIAIFDKNKMFVSRAVGDVSNLAKKVDKKKVAGQVGIGHTRWATHGRVTVTNAHPHLDCSKTIAVVHNGIVENFDQLKKELLKKKHKIISETDTEIVVHLIEDELRSVEEELKRKEVYSPYEFARAVYRIFRRLEGLNAIVVGSFKASCIVAFRSGSSLSVGIEKDSLLLSSDLPTLTGYTKNIVLLDEGEGTLLIPNRRPVFFSNEGRKIRKSVKRISFEERVADKGGYPHFMLKEIHEQALSLSRLAAYPRVPIVKAAEMIKNAYGTYFTACGTAAYAGLAATYLFSDIAKWHVNFAVGSEFYFLEEFLKPRSLLIVASQSGETMDTLEAVKAAKRHKSKVVSLVNVPGSTLSRMSDFSLELLSGPEKAVASTKAYTSKLALFLLLAYAVSGRLQEGIKVVDETQKAVENMFKKGMNETVARIAKDIVRKQSIFIIGRGLNYPTALEAALKIKEISYIHAEGFPGGELKHGVIALIEKGTPCIVFVANDETREDVVANAIELKSRGAFVIGVGPSREEVFDEFVKVPDVGFASPIVNVIPAQLLAYHLAVLKGFNPDKPRNLAKSVTVK
ncbi:MAG: glutamine--fructose-6-phosphate transaminase (isomerizing) [Candidatus Blackburnbacteria bacterium]|nr:glutamine--fructose-6-phosphate transaminase (isomerizing) [Candidatus Blackburnbacteria bacterium]